MKKDDGSENLAALLAWSGTQSDDDFRQIIRGGQLNRSEISKGAGITRQCLTKNPRVKAAIESLERELRERGVLPPLALQEPSEDTPLRRHDPKANTSLKAGQRASALEKEVVTLRAEVAQLKASLSRYGELSEVIGELGLIPQ